MTLSGMGNGPTKMSRLEMGRRTFIAVSTYQPRLLWIFVLACVVPLALAIYTQNAWEDFYITFRASRNLATGQGLVFNVGDHLQTFTSPLQALLLALASVLTGNASDADALWLYRGVCIIAFGVTVTLLFATTIRLRYPSMAAIGLVCLLLTDAKSIIFIINGMETAFLLLGFAYAFWAMFSGSTRAPLHLGIAWGCMMWARPDSFIYIGAFAAAVFLFNQPWATSRTRAEWLRLFVGAGAVAALVYLPWFIFSWAYYGSPVPHTVIAKSMMGSPFTTINFFQFLRHPPKQMLDSLFMPPYAVGGGWPAGIRLVSRGIAIALCIAWVLPGLRTETRATSFTLLCGIFYLSYFSPFPFPWYFCLPALLAFVTLVGLLTEAISAARKIASQATAEVLKYCFVGSALMVVLVGAWLTLQSAKTWKLDQTINAPMNRELGLWLRERASAGDTVLLEPLGYIGYFSGLKTYDVPGLSSREVVEVERHFGVVWGAIATELRPTWLVLRPSEVEAIRETHPHLLEEQYEPVRAFDVRDNLAGLSFYGYIENGSVFTIFHRRPAA
jgi:hypothetical protein